LFGEETALASSEERRTGRLEDDITTMHPQDSEKSTPPPLPLQDVRVPAYLASTSPLDYAKALLHPESLLHVEIPRITKAEEAAKIPPFGKLSSLTEPPPEERKI